MRSPSQPHVQIPTDVPSTGHVIVREVTRFRRAGPNDEDDDAEEDHEVAGWIFWIFFIFSQRTIFGDGWFGFFLSTFFRIQHFLSFLIININNNDNATVLILIG